MLTSLRCASRTNCRKRIKKDLKVPYLWIAKISDVDQDHQDLGDNGVMNGKAHLPTSDDEFFWGSSGEVKAAISTFARNATWSS